MKILVIVLMIAATGWSRPATALPNHLWQILSVGGIYHGSDVNPNSCLKWYGLFETQNGFALKAVRLDVRAVRHTLVDTAGQKTGKKLSIQPSGETVFLVGTDRPLKEGSVEGDRLTRPPAELTPGDNPLKPGKQIPLSLQEKDYTLSLMKDGAQLVLKNGEKSQTLLPDVGRFDTPSVVWYGDLDRDGELDLLLDEGKENLRMWLLFLSSEVWEEWELVGGAARWMVTGC